MHSVEYNIIIETSSRKMRGAGRGDIWLVVIDKESCIMHEEDSVSSGVVSNNVVCSVIYYVVIAIKL